MSGLHLYEILAQVRTNWWLKKKPKWLPLTELTEKGHKGTLGAKNALYIDGGGDIHICQKKYWLEHLIFVHITVHKFYIQTAENKY